MQILNTANKNKNNFYNYVLDCHTLSFLFIYEIDSIQPVTVVESR